MTPISEAGETVGRMRDSIMNKPLRNKKILANWQQASRLRVRFENLQWFSIRAGTFDAICMLLLDSSGKQLF